MSFDWRARVDELPRTPGVYLFFGAAGLLYVGKSVNLKERVRSYFQEGGGHTERTGRLRHETQHVSVQATRTELDALLLESALIKQLQPRYNVRGRQQEHYPFVKLSNELFPRLLVTRVLAPDGARYFGPFWSARRLTELIEILGPLTGVRSCGVLPERACLQRDLGRCLAPCVGPEPAAYAAAVEELTALLRGEAGPMLRRLEQGMQEASARCDFERAAVLRDRGAAIAGWVAYLRRVDELRATDRLHVARHGDGAVLTLVRRARWTAQLLLPATQLGRGTTRRIGAWLVRTLAMSPPPVLIHPREVDEVQLVGGWLYRQRRDPDLLVVTPADLGQVARQAGARALTMRE